MESINEASIWFNKGTAFYYHGKYNEAVKCYDKAIRIR
ncbi:MAG: tetratricopeptide repeat protein, partial [Actinobacteria bacterium]|nr:tetratricopeptide repeat protein [Actinomycetota bacterium]